jgi:predicted SnoaL-like aldol condensation-catalyzing enzyme
MIWIAQMSHDLDKNKKNAIDFYRTAYLGNPEAAVENYVGAAYIQHNPVVADGKQAFVDYFDEMEKDYPGKSIEFVRAVGEGDLVALHTHQTWPAGDQYVTMDFFRFDENGKIIEHWDSIQEIPEETRNGNPMY